MIGNGREFFDDDPLASNGPFTLPLDEKNKTGIYRMIRNSDAAHVQSNQTRPHTKRPGT